MNSNAWVDFRAVKTAVTMQMTLDHYGVNWLRKSKDELRGRCPIHKGEGTDTFHVNAAKSAFHCFSCKKQGNVLDFVAAMEDCGVREAAEKLADWFSITSSDSPGTPATSPAQNKTETSRGEEREQNKPLAFQLKGIDPTHPFLASRGIDKATAEMFGVGFFPGKGSMAGRVVIPIHNERGDLLAYAGRSIDGSEPKYKLPTGFHKSLELYNLHRAVKNNDQGMVVVVEVFFDCMKVQQAGLPAVALMGS